MRHAKKGKKIATDAAHRKAMLRSLTAALLEHEKIRTTEVRAKELRPVVDKVVTLAKRGDVHARRQAMAVLGDKALVHKVFSEIGPRFAERSGGYTRIVKIGPRQGDAAAMVLIELV